MGGSPEAALARDPAYLIVRGKGGKERVVPVLPVARAAIAAYLGAQPWGLGPDDPLFRGVRGKRLSAGAVEKAMVRLRHALGHFHLLPLQPARRHGPRPARRPRRSRPRRA